MSGIRQTRVISSISMKTALCSLSHKSLLSFVVITSLGAQTENERLSIMGLPRYINAHYYDINDDTKTVIADMGTDVIILPQITQNYGTGYIYENNAPTELFVTWSNGVSLFESLGCKCKNTYNSVGYDYSKFSSMFPRFNPIIFSDTIGIVNEKNKMFLHIISGRSYLYSSLEAYTNGASPIYNVGTPTSFLTASLVDSSGADRGAYWALGYYAVDDEGIITSFSDVQFKGVTSTTGKIRILGFHANRADAIYTRFFGVTEEFDIEPEDPYNEDPEDPTEFDDGTSDDIDFPTPPQITAVDTGFITLYNPSLAQLKSLANYMWSGAFDLDTFKKIFADPMDAILGLSLLPVPIPSGSARAVTVGNISTGVSMTVAGSQFVTVDCGSLTVKRTSPGSYLDYSPYTKAELFLPCIGTHPIDVDEIMNKTIHIMYTVDILSGACTAHVKVGSSVLYEFNGSCAVSVPITGNDWTNVLNGAVSVAASIGTMVATGGATAPMAAATIASAAVNNLKPNIEKSGSLSGPGGLLGVKRPYLILSRPRRQIPSRQNAYIGYPAYTTKKLDDVSGYNVIEDIHLDNISGATAEELNEIETLLKSGVIL